MRLFLVLHTLPLRFGLCSTAIRSSGNLTTSSATTLNAESKPMSSEA
jgi:hypothetical protein